jgi:hypothetical protein
MEGFDSRRLGQLLLILGFGHVPPYPALRSTRLEPMTSLSTSSHIPTVKSVALQARVGIATGLAVVGGLIGEGSAQEQSVVGETPNLAALHYWPPPVVGALITTQRVLASGLP